MPMPCQSSQNLRLWLLPAGKANGHGAVLLSFPSPCLTRLTRLATRQTPNPLQYKLNLSQTVLILLFLLMTNNLDKPLLLGPSATDGQGDLLYSIFFYFSLTCLRVVGQVRSGDGTVAEGCGVLARVCVLYSSRPKPALGLFLALPVVCPPVFLSL